MGPAQEGVGAGGTHCPSQTKSPAKATRFESPECLALDMESGALHPNRHLLKPHQGRCANPAVPRPGLSFPLRKWGKGKV